MVNLSISANDVHIYLIQASDNKDKIPILREFLNIEEQKKADAFIFENDRINNIISRAGIKIILSRYLFVKPEDIVFINNEFGKPFLNEKINPEKITFNLSHSANYIIFAIAKDKNIGVDVQEKREILSFEDIINEFFSIDEKIAFQEIPNELKKNAFYTCWTRKEAYIKAHGKGLSYPLNQFTVSILPNSNAVLLNDEKTNVLKWTFKDIEISSEFSASVAVEAENVKFKFYTLDL